MRNSGTTRIAPNGNKIKNKIKSQEPNPAFEGTRGYALACFLGVRAPAPLNSVVGRCFFVLAAIFYFFAHFVFSFYF